MRIAVIDGQGGGIGRVIVEKLRQAGGASYNIIALGTNALATSIMLRAGANEGSTGENAIVYNAGRVDIIAGSVACLSANSYGGELSPQHGRGHQRIASPQGAYSAQPQRHLHSGHGG